MGRRIPLFMILAVIAGFGVIILMNIITLTRLSSAKYLSPSDVRGMAVVHKKLIYTLNFDQQNTLVDIFNRSFPISKAEAEARGKETPSDPEIQKIVIYRFNAPEIAILPIGYVSKTYSQDGSKPVEHLNLIFSAPEWNPDGLMEESAQDQMRDILYQTYDP